MVIEDAQGVERLVEILRRRQFQPGGALSQEFFIVRQHIARLVGGMPFEHVTEKSLIHRLGDCGRQIGVRQGILGGQRQGMALLGG